MGALAPLSPWIPEDDLLLKNAVEAGASLESLAKGAVQFSRKFTVRELQERWHSLLYDPIVSAEAAFRMIEFQCSASTPPSKFSKSGNSKENKCASAKRKAESVRSCYYALRKRICNEPFNSVDLSFLIASADSDYIGNDNEPLSGDYMLGDPVSTHFGLQESNLDIMQQSFAEIGDDNTAHIFHASYQNTAHESYPVQDNMHGQVQHLDGEDLCLAKNRSAIDELCGPNELPANTDQVHECANFDGDHVFSSPIPACDVSFHSLEYLSPLPEMPMWRTVGGASPSGIPINVRTGDAFSLPHSDDTKNTCLTEYDIHRKSILKIEIPNEEMKNVNASTEGYLAELSNSLLNFTNDEDLLFTDADGKDAISKSYYDGLSSLLLNSPNDINQDHMMDVTEPDSSLTLDNVSNQCGPSHGQLEEDKGSHSGDVVGNSDSQLPELCAEVVTCVLNTEDSEIPCNDDVVFTNHLRQKSFSSVARQNFHDNKSNNSTAKEFSGNPKTSEGAPMMIPRDLENSGQPHPSSQVARSQVKPEIGSLQPVGDRGVKFDFPISSPTGTNAGIAYGGSSQLNLTNAPETLGAAKAKEETPEVMPIKHLSNNSVDIEAPGLGPDGYKCQLQTNVGVVKQDPDALERNQNHQAHTNLGSLDMASSDQVVNQPVSDPEEPCIESDDDVPYFSDVEAMLLDMDLDPEDQDLYSSEGVSKYQHEDVKRVIMRLEQCAQSYMQRAMAMQGAFAVLYGRHSKHYIKKPEVLLGRATEDVIVDIDLGREGRANIISRKQAVLSLDKNGSFCVRNLGRCPISVNDTEITTGQSLSLTSGCLIEIRDMPFIFETNQACVKQYLDSIKR